MTPQSAALRSLFFASTALKKSGAAMLSRAPCTASAFSAAV